MGSLAKKLRWSDFFLGGGLRGDSDSAYASLLNVTSYSLYVHIGLCIKNHIIELFEYT